MTQTTHLTSAVFLPQEWELRQEEAVHRGLELVYMLLCCGMSATRQMQVRVCAGAEGEVWRWGGKKTQKKRGKGAEY